MSDDRKLGSCQQKLKLIRSLIHYCSQGELGVYSSASGQILKIVDELEADLASMDTHPATVSQSEQAVFHS